MGNGGSGADTLARRMDAEMADSFDEELELDDDRLAELVEGRNGASSEGSLDRHLYFKELFRLQGELVKLQDWVVSEKRKLVVIFEGRNAAGRGSAIKRISQRLNPRALSVPCTERAPCR